MPVDEYMNDSPREIIGSSPRTCQIIRMGARLGQSECAVLILGESGTGKELVARMIHQTHPKRPFVVIDCAAMVGSLVESELFGHVKGSFTGAATNKVGLIEAANGGTAFFDEIGEMPLDMQTKLLRVIQEKQFRPVGSLVSRKSSFRVIAATNRDLKKEVEAGRFRADLYYRLGVVTLRLPPLRERKDDIPLLVQHFLRKYRADYTLSGEVLELFQSYDWPGNVRQLENAVQHMVAVNSGPVVHTGDLPSALINFQLGRRSHGAAMAATVDGGTRVQPAGGGGAVSNGAIVPLAELERQAIFNALKYTRGDRMAAAMMLGIGRTTLYRKLKEYTGSDKLEDAVCDNQPSDSEPPNRS